LRNQNYQAALAAFGIFIIVTPFQPLTDRSLRMVLLLILHVFDYPLQILCAETDDAITLLSSSNFRLAIS
jgi:hypothetical protein